MENVKYEQSRKVRPDSDLARVGARSDSYAGANPEG